MIHELTGDAIPKEIPGLKDVHAVDASGVHPLLLAIGSERYTPYYKERKPQEILTIANHILGTGQLSLAKYVFIIAGEDDKSITTHQVQNYFKHVLERADWKRDLHFHTQTTIDTLDYSGNGLNSGSKLVIAAAGNKSKDLATDLPSASLPDGFYNPKMVMPGVIAIKTNPFADQQQTAKELEKLNGWDIDHSSYPLLIICDDSDFVARTLNNFLWITFTRSNPSHDIYGIHSFVENKHWGCRGSLIIDARVKTHHAPELIKDPAIEKRVDALGEKGKSLYGII